MKEEEFLVLAHLENSAHVSHTVWCELVKRLLARGWLTRNFAGDPVITESGKQAMFLQLCISELSKISSGEVIAIDNPIVYAWLASQKFIKPNDAEQARVLVSQRGKYWLSTLCEKQHQAK